MELIPIACHHCGAPLDVPPQAEIVTCQHCTTRLAVHRNESVAWTEMLEELDERTEYLESSVDWLCLQRELDELDRSWQLQQQSAQRAGAMCANSSSRFSGPVFAWLPFSLFLVLTIFVALHDSLAAVFTGMLGLMATAIVGLIEDTSGGRSAFLRQRALLQHRTNREMARRLYEQRRAELHQKYNVSLNEA